MDEIEHNAKIVDQGCFEEMIDSMIEMEGGREAFDLRYKKYQQVIELI
jgi:hypothetical protein